MIAPPHNLGTERLLAALACPRSRCACHRARSRATHCPAHEDRAPSLGVTEQAGRVLVICRAGCPQAAVIAALRARGLWSAASPPRRPISPEEQARRDVLAKGRRDAKRLAEYAEVFATADSIRIAHRTVAGARHVATRLGDGDEAWALLERAARLETETINAERPDGHVEGV